MNESSYINNSFNLASFSTPSLGGANITSSYSTSHINAVKASTFSNNTNSTTLTDNLNHHSSQLNLNLNLINRQMSNMLLNTKNVLNCNKKNHFVLHSFSFQYTAIENTERTKLIKELNDINIKQEIYFRQIQEENNQLRSNISSLHNENCYLIEENKRLKNEISNLNASLLLKRRQFIDTGNEQLNTTRNFSFLNEMNGNYNSNSNNSNNTVIMNESCFVSNDKDKKESPFKTVQHSNNSNNTCVSRYNTIETNVNLYTKKTVVQQKKKDVNNGNSSNNNYVHRHSVELNSMCTTNRIKSSFNNNNNNTTLNPSLSTTKLYNKTAYHIIEKKVSLSQKKISIDNNNTTTSIQTEPPLKTYHKSKTPKSLSISKDIKPPTTTQSAILPQSTIQRQQREINLCIKDDTEPESQPLIQYLYKFNIKSKSITLFNTVTKAFNTIQYQLETASFPALYEEEGSVYLTTNKGIYVITGGTYKSFYFYSHNDNTIKKLPSLKNNHCKGRMILYNNKYILCISGCDNNSIEQYEIGSSKWNELIHLDEPRCGCNCLIMNVSYLFVLFGYNYIKNNYVNSICYINLLEESNAQWRYVMVKGCSLNIKDYVMVNSIKVNDDHGKVLIFGGCCDDGVNCKSYVVDLSLSEADIKCKNDESENKMKFESGLFNEGFVVNYNTNNNDNNQCENWGIDINGTVYHFETFDTTYKCYYPELNI